MEKEDIAQLPREFILNFAAEGIDEAWTKLPEKYRHDEEFLARTKCRFHDHADKRVAPMVKDCKLCQQFEDFI